MAWQYNYTSRLYLCRIEDGSLFFNSHLDRSIEQEQKGWSPCKGIALDYVWSDGKWTCQERIEYDPVMGRYLVGTEKWKGVRGGMEFRRYQDLGIRLLQHEEAFKSPELPEQCQETIANLFRELKKKARFKN